MNSNQTEDILNIEEQLNSKQESSIESQIPSNPTQKEFQTIDRLQKILDDAIEERNRLLKEKNEKEEKTKSISNDMTEKERQTSNELNLLNELKKMKTQYDEIQLKYQRKRRISLTSFRKRKRN